MNVRRNLRPYTELSVDLGDSMQTIKLENHGNTRMIAHRGLSGLKVENTLSAFKAAGKAGYYGIESDVHVTKDGKFIIFHDDTTRRLSRVNLEVEQTDYKTLRMLPIKLHRMPSLSEYIRCCKNYSKVAVLELKNQMEKGSVSEIVKTISEQNYLKETVFISFSKQNLKYIREIEEQQSVQ